MKFGKKLEISQVNNGYLCEGFMDDEGFGEMQLDEVFVVEDGEDCDKHETMSRLLQQVMRYFEVFSSKHNEMNCRVVLEKKREEKWKD